jgi:short-subunit dehydrogenase
MSRVPFAASYGPWALVAGGSTGIGAAFADEIARRGVNLVLVARRSGPLERTAARLRADRAVEVVTVPADLADPAGLEAVYQAAADLPVGLLVANAAVIPTGPFLAAAEDEIAAAIDLNCRASTLLARRYLPAMTERGRGGVIFVSSLAGMQGVPGLAAYSATKSYLITLGESLWAELRGRGVHVVTVCAGAVSSPDGPQAARPAPGTSTPAEVARAGLGGLGRGFRVVPGGVNRVSAVALQRLAPRRAAIALVGRASAGSLE